MENRLPGQESYGEIRFEKEDPVDRPKYAASRWTSGFVALVC
jgi:hypothetical protein